MILELLVAAAVVLGGLCIAPPALMALAWVVLRIGGEKVSFKKLMKDI